MGDVVVERVGGRVEIVLDRPERKNAITLGLARELRDALRSVAADAGCVVLRGAGGAFCSGLDLKAPDRPGPVWAEVHAALYRCPVPVVVALERFAINAGAALALAADLVVAGESAFLQVGEAALGVPAPMCQAWLHLRHSPAVGDRVTLVADRIEAFELLRLGIVTEVVDDAAVVDRARELADRIAGYPPEGRAGLARTWSRLRPPLADPEAWFASLAAGVVVP